MKQQLKPFRLSMFLAEKPAANHQPSKPQADQGGPSIQLFTVPQSEDQHLHLKHPNITFEKRNPWEGLPLETRLKLSIQKLVSDDFLDQEYAQAMQETYQQFATRLNRPAKIQPSQFIMLADIDRQIKEIEAENEFMIDEVKNMKIIQKQIIKDNRYMRFRLQQLKGLIPVYCRVRPLNQGSNCCKTSAQKDLLVVTSTQKRHNRLEEIECPYPFDYVFDEKASQEDVFEEFAPVVESSVLGNRVCVFAYGQPGSGNTYNLLGSPLDEGLANRALNLIFDIINQEEEDGWSYVVTMAAQQLSYKGRKDFVTNVLGKDIKTAFLTINSKEQAKFYLTDWANSRMTSKTNKNTNSSRSHFLVSIHMQAKKYGQPTRNGVACFIDLAGSESSKTTTNEDQTNFINLSLSSLITIFQEMITGVICAPAQKTLPAALKKYLGRDTLAMALISVSPDSGDCKETINSAKFATDLKKIVRK